LESRRGIEEVGTEEGHRAPEAVRAGPAAVTESLLPGEAVQNAESILSRLPSSDEL